MGKLNLSMKIFPWYQQLDSMDCGPTCLKIIAKYYGKSFSIRHLRERCYLDREGVSLKGISEGAESIGLRSVGVQLPLAKNNGEQSLSQMPLPCIAHWRQKHFVVVYKITKDRVYVSDPAKGKVKYSHREFNSHYTSNGEKGISLLIETTPSFFNNDQEEKSVGFAFLLQYLKPHYKLLIQLILGLFIGTIIQLVFPFLTQSLVDIGIDTQNLNFIYLVLIGQLFLFVSETVVRFIQSWILLHVSIRINVNLISDFLLKLMKLTLGFFDTKNIGDLLQRINDHKRIETFLTHSILSILLSILNLLVFGIVLAIYSSQIFLIFLISGVCYVSWILIFLKKRKEIDHKKFTHMSDNQDAIIEIIKGMPEIKLQGSQTKRRWQWAEIQARLFKTQMKSLSIVQYQDAGALSINKFKDIVITFIAAKSVLDGSLTLGMMLAIQYIIGQLNYPLQQLVSFIRSAQDAHISIERLAEIHNGENEEQDFEQKIKNIPTGDISIENLSFSYSPISKMVLTNISCIIPQGKTTAIVGGSGSGKTTLVKLVLGFYDSTHGQIKIGNSSLNNVSKRAWRKRCGVVMQEGFIFSDSIAANVAESDDIIDYSKVESALQTANISDFVHNLPLGLNTTIGSKGNGLSQGQKQRLLIARAVYKNPDFIFFDEATNALDAINEKVITSNLNEFFHGKTSVVVAHRLSTVKNADQIIVLDNGQIVEQGDHTSLTNKRGYYYTLVKNQLELGK